MMFYQRINIDLIAIVSIEKLFFDFGYPMENRPLEEETVYYTFEENLWRCAENVSCEEVGNLDFDNYNLIYRFSDPAMTEYFRLCNEYGKKHHIRYAVNPFVLEAKNHVFEWMNGISSWSYAWDFKYKAQDSFIPQLLFEYYPSEFMEYVEAIQAILNVMGFFKEGVFKLNRELNATVALSAAQSKEAA